MNYITPNNGTLRSISESLIELFNKGSEPTPEQQKKALVQSVEVLRKHPIPNCSALCTIFKELNANFCKGEKRRYEYINIVNEQEASVLRRLNAILNTFNGGITAQNTREFTKLAVGVFDEWQKLWQYSEIYEALVVMLDCSNGYEKLDIFKTLKAIKEIYSEVMKSDFEPIKEPFPVEVSLADRYECLRIEILVYYGETAYAALSGDKKYEKMPEKVDEYIKKCSCIEKKTEPTEEDIMGLERIEREGWTIFSRLRNVGGGFIKWANEKPLQLGMREVSEFEKLNEYEFPDDFKSCVWKYNGGKPNANTFDTGRSKGRAIKHLLSFNREDKESIWDISEWNKDELSDKYVAFAIDDAGNLIAFDKADSQVVFINHEEPATIERVAESFADFLNKLYE